MGTSYKNDIDKAFGEDHPHAYGDKNKMFGLDIWYQGSSPRVWGQVLISTLLSLYSRIIPTRMGTSYVKPFYQL